MPCVLLSDPLHVPLAATTAACLYWKLYLWKFFSFVHVSITFMPFCGCLNPRTRSFPTESSPSSPWQVARAGDFLVFSRCFKLKARGKRIAVITRTQHGGMLNSALFVRAKGRVRRRMFRSRCYFIICNNSSFDSDWVELFGSRRFALSLHETQDPEWKVGGGKTAHRFVVFDSLNLQSFAFLLETFFFYWNSSSSQEKFLSLVPLFHPFGRDIDPKKVFLWLELRK
jgi:hypothetical protein